MPYAVYTFLRISLPQRWVHVVAGGTKRRLDVTPARAEGSLAVTQGLVVAVNGLDLVEARPAIYVVPPVCVARVDKVVAVASIHLVVAFARDDLVVPLAAPEAVLAALAFQADR